MVEPLQNEITLASQELFRLLRHSLIGIHRNKIRLPLSSEVKGYARCMGDDAMLYVDNSQGTRIVELTNDGKQWKRLDTFNVGVVVSDVDKGVAVIEQAWNYGVRNKSWVIISESLKPYYFFNKIQSNDPVFVLSKNCPQVLPEQFINFHDHLKNQTHPWKIHSLINLLDWSPFLIDYPCHSKPFTNHAIQNLNDVADIFSTISLLQSALYDMLCTEGSCQEIRNVTSTIGSLRQVLNSSYLTDGYLKYPCKSTNVYGSSQMECLSDRYILNKVHFANTCRSSTFEKVGTWSNNSGWEINPSDLKILRNNNSWKCLSGSSIQIPPYIDNCVQQACLTCPMNNQADIMSWREEYCQLCTPNKCIDLGLTFVSFSHPLALSVTCLCVIGEILLIFVVLIFAKFRETPVVKSSNRMFNFFTLTTLGVWFAVIPTFLGRPKYFSCNALVAFFFVVYATVTSIQLTKTVRLLLIFKSMRQPSKMLGNTSFFLKTIAFIVIQSIISVLDYMVYPVHLKTVLHHDTILMYCDQRLSPLSALAFAYNCLLATACGILAYRARNLPQNFNEAKNMFFAIISYTISWTITIGGYFSEKLAELQTAVVSLGFVIGAFSVLISLFFPKIRVIFFYPQLNTKSANREGTRRYSVDASASIGTVRPQRSRSSTIDIQHTKPEQRRPSVPTNSFRTRTMSDSSFIQLFSEAGHRWTDTAVSEFPSSVTLTTTPMSSV